jgi:hypothetical protein
LQVKRSRDESPEPSLTKRRQLDKIFPRHDLQWLTGFAPGGQAAYQDERVESFFSQQVRHPGAGPFARSSAIQVYVLVFGQPFQLLLKIVGLDADGTLDARGIGIVVAVAADIDDENAPGRLRSEFLD